MRGELTKSGSKKDHCLDCAAWWFLAGTDTGECRRRAPTGNAPWGVTTHYDGCYEFVPLKRRTNDPATE